MSFTPGPWTIFNSEQIASANAQLGDRAVAILAIREEEEQKANARLIAASPSLLAAAEQLIQVVELYQLNELRQRPYRELKWAVEKARGEDGSI